MMAVCPANWSTKNRLRTWRFYLRCGHGCLCRSKDKLNAEALSSRRNIQKRLAEDIFDFVEDRGIAVGGLVFHFESGAELLDQFALIAGELDWRQHADVIIQITFAAAARIGQSSAFDAKHGAALRAFWNFQLLFSVQSRHLQFGAQGRLSDAQRNRAIQVRSAPFEERMLFDFKHDV